MLRGVDQKQLQTSPAICFFNDTATTEIYTLSLHDALPIFETTVSPSSTAATAARGSSGNHHTRGRPVRGSGARIGSRPRPDRKSTRLNSSHANMSYSVLCFEKKKNTSQMYAVAPDAIQILE